MNESAGHVSGASGTFRCLSAPPAVPSSSCRGCSPVAPGPGPASGATCGPGWCRCFAGAVSGAHGEAPPPPAREVRAFVAISPPLGWTRCVVVLSCPGMRTTFPDGRPRSGDGRDGRARPAPRAAPRAAAARRRPRRARGLRRCGSARLIEHAQHSAWPVRRCAGARHARVRDLPPAAGPVPRWLLKTRRSARPLEEVVSVCGRTRVRAGRADRARHVVGGCARTGGWQRGRGRATRARAGRAGRCGVRGARRCGCRRWRPFGAGVGAGRGLTTGWSSGTPISRSGQDGGARASWTAR